MDTLNFLTGNSGKLREAQIQLEQLGWNVQQFMIDGTVPDIVEPQSSDLTSVALAKVAQAVELLASQGRMNEPLLVEDTGLFIDSLMGFPGVYSSHALQTIGNQGVLRMIDDNRSAHFLTVVALWTGEFVEVFTGRCDGQISMEISGQDGFGFDPIFIPDDDVLNRTFSEMTTIEKSAFSHRSKALKSLFDFLEGDGP